MLIHELARISGLSKDGVRHYEALGLISSAPRQAGSRVYRDYAMAAIETIEKVRQAQRLGFSLKEIGPLLKAYGENPPSREEEVAFLEARLAVIREKLAALGDVEDFICRKLERYRGT
jgi:DNA-binding transcriptional MerR regulator